MVSDEPFNDIINEALKIKWTRDVFDRMFVAEARVKKAHFITADQQILDNFNKAVW